MRSLSVREWDYLQVGSEPNPDLVTRAEADRLMMAAELAQAALWQKGGNGERVLVDGHRRLRAQQVVGVLVAGDVALEILPKIDGVSSTEQTRQNLVHMLARVLDLRIADGSLSHLDWQSHDLLEILITVFRNKLQAALRMGLHRQYVEQRDDLALLRGRLDSKRQFTVLAGTPERIASIYDELSPDTPLNRILKATVIFLQRLARSLENRRQLVETLSAFDEVKIVPPSALRWDQVHLDRTSTAFHELFRLARFLLASRYQTTSSGRTAGLSLLFEMNMLFEEFIGRELARALRGWDMAISLQGPAAWALEDAAGKGHFRTRPDIVLSRKRENFAVLDTKWKRISRSGEGSRLGISPADVYQMMAYSQVYSSPNVILVYPHHAGLGPDPGLLSSFGIRGLPGRFIKIASVSLDSIPGVGSQLRAICTHALETEKVFPA